MGEVYLGEKVGPEGFVKPVVLKCVLPQLAKDRAFVQLFLDEARLAALLNHPNIAQVYDFGQADDVYYMAMEYVPGYTVDDIRRKHRAIDKFMPIEHIACIASQACQGLQYAHTLTDARNVSLGLVHRDVSPHNLIVSVDGAVKIVDFGIAKARSGLTRVQAKGAVGKFGYMSPEQSRGESVDCRTDVFSLGVCIWELMTNRRLHDAKIDRPPEYRPDRPVPTVGAFRRDVAKQFERLLKTSLAIEPDSRYNDCHEMHLDLERFLAAMTHYAGQSALSGYIKELVEGRIENPPEDAKTGAEPATVVSQSPRNGRSGPRIKEAEGLAGAQKYEEVFGTAIDDAVDESSNELRAVPKSWETKKVDTVARPAPVSTPPEPKRRRRGPPGMNDDDPPLELDLPQDRLPNTRVTGPVSDRKRQEQARAQRLSRAPEAVRKGGGSKAPIFIVLLLLLIGVGGAGWFFRDQISAKIKGATKANENKGPVLASNYRLISTPEGADVFLDGTKKGVTPVVLELLPGIRYVIELKHDDYATKRAALVASVGEGIRPLRFQLGPPGTLRITSEPSAAKIAIDGIELPGVTTPAKLIDVPAGQTLRVTVVKPGMAPVTQETTVANKASRKLHFNLKGR